MMSDERSDGAWVAVHVGLRLLYFAVQQAETQDLLPRPPEQGLDVQQSFCAPMQTIQECVGLWK